MVMQLYKSQCLLRQEWGFFKEKTAKMQARTQYIIIMLLAIAALILLVLTSQFGVNSGFNGLSMLLILAILLLAAYGWVYRPVKEVPSSLKVRSARQSDLEKFTKSLSLPFMILSHSGRILYHSKALKTLFPSISAMDHYSKLARSPQFVDTVRLALEGEKTDPFIFETLREPVRVYEVMISPIHKEQKGFIEGEIVVEIHDRTEERRADIARRDFIANASHELRTPLSAIIGGIESLNDNADQDTLNHFLPIMSKQAGRMERLIADLMALSRVEMNEHMPPRDKVNLKDILDDSLAALATRKAFKNVKITNLYANSYDADDKVRGDADQLQQIMLNILDNAAKYGGNPCEITITRESDDPCYPNMIGMKFADNGAGIAREHLQRLTERFYRVSATESRNKGGTGLGLAIVKHMLRRHRGDLEIDSQLGKGSAFTIWLPLKKSSKNK